MHLYKKYQKIMFKLETTRTYLIHEKNPLMNNCLRGIKNISRLYSNKIEYTKNGYIIIDYSIYVHRSS